MAFTWQRLFIAASVVLFVLAALIVLGTVSVSAGAAALAYIGLACFAAGHL